MKKILMVIAVILLTSFTNNTPQYDEKMLLKCYQAGYIRATKRCMIDDINLHTWHQDSLEFAAIIYE